MFIGDSVGNEKGIFLNDSGGNSNEFALSSIVEEKVFAKVLLAMQAEEAGVAGS